MSEKSQKKETLEILKNRDAREVNSKNDSIVLEKQLLSLQCNSCTPVNEKNDQPFLSSYFNFGQSIIGADEHGISSVPKVNVNFA